MDRMAAHRQWHAVDPAPETPPPALLRVENLSLEVTGRNGNLPILENVSFSVPRGSVVAIVGESGCGKSTTALSIMQILPPEIAVTGGRILLEGSDVIALSDAEIRAVRGSAMSMIFQDPMTSLNPVLTIGEQLIETVFAHRQVGAAEARTIALQALRDVRIPDPEKRLREYPHQLSGGMRQRIVIAMALACRPRLLIADEPTTALDVTIQLQILMLLKDLQRQYQTGIILITHNIGIVAEMADVVVVMYAGRIVEEGPVETILSRPAHPYTRGLIAATPPFVRRDPGPRGRLVEIEGMVPPLGERLDGCAFRPRCRGATVDCGLGVPAYVELGRDHRAACLHPLTRAVGAA